MTRHDVERLGEVFEFSICELRDALYELADAIRALAKSTKGGVS